MFDIPWQRRAINDPARTVIARAEENVARIVEKRGERPGAVNGNARSGGAGNARV